MPEYLYDVALSFAGAERDYVRDVAHELKRTGHTIFFDEDEEVSLWGENLIERLDEIYRKQARFVVVFISKSYAQRVWTRLERRSALTRALHERAAFVLPARFDDTELPGLLSSVAYISLRNVGPIQLASRIAAKVANTSAPRVENDQVAWEFRLFADELKRGMHELRQLRQDHRAGFARPTREWASTVREIPPLISALAAEAAQWTGNIDRVLSVRKQEAAFGAPGQPGDEASIKQLASSLTRVYQGLIEWAQRVRGISVPDGTAELMWSLSRFSETPVEQYEAFVEAYGRTVTTIIDRLRTGVPLEESKFDLTLTLSIAPEILRDYERAFGRFKKRFRRELR